MMNILILGGSSEASQVANAVAPFCARPDICAILSYAGRVRHPKPQPIPLRTGGFGGVEGLCHYLRRESITHVVDATHPFATRISANAQAACQHEKIPLLVFTRPAWHPQTGDNWQIVPDLDAALSALSGPPQRLLLALGRMQIAAFTAKPQHHYILRLVDPMVPPPPLPNHTILLDRGPFAYDAEYNLLRSQKIDRIVCKNSGGEAAAPKLHAARDLGLPVLMIERSPLPEPAPPQTTALEDVTNWLFSNKIFKQGSG